MEGGGCGGYERPLQRNPAHFGAGHGRNLGGRGGHPAQHLAVDQIEGTRLCHLPGATVMSVRRQLRLCEAHRLAMCDPGGMTQRMRQRAMLRSQQQRNQRAAQPSGMQSRTQETGHVMKRAHG